MFDLGPMKLVALVVLAVVIFGPDKLPGLVAEVVKFLRAARSFADSAKEDIREGLGPEFQDFEFEDLNPKAFVRKQLAAHGADYGVVDLLEVKQDLVQGADRPSAALQSARANRLGDAAIAQAPPAPPVPVHTLKDADAT